MILTITHEAARKLAVEDAHRAMKAAEYDGVGFDRGDSYDDYRFQGLGDVLILNPGATLQDEVVQTYEQAYRETWHLA